MAGVQIDGVNNKIDFDDDQDTSISANTDDTLVFEIAGATDFTMTANTFTAASGSTIAAQALTATSIVSTGDVTLTGASNNAVWDSSNNSLDFADSAQLRFGAGADLKIFHDGSDSHIVDSGTGNLKISTSALQIMNAAGNENLVLGTADGAVTLYHDNSAKLATTSTGISVTGTGTFTTADNSDTLTLTSTDADGNAGPNLRLYRNTSSPADNDLVGIIDFEGRNDNSQDVVYAAIQLYTSDVSDGTEDGALLIRSMVNGTNTQRITLMPTETVINEDSNDLDFRVEGNGQTHMLHVNAGDDSLHIADTGTEAHRLIVQHDGSNEHIARFKHSDGTPEGLIIQFTGGAPDGVSANFLECSDTGTTRLIIQSDGDLQNHDNAYGAISDERIKEQIKDSSSQWDDIKAMKIRKYKMKDDVAAKGDSDALWRIGVIAQELEASGMNGLVKDEVLYEEGEPNMGDNKAGDMKNPKTVKYSILYMKAIKALQEAMAKIETLETKVAALEG